MEIKFIKEGKWFLDMPNNKMWNNICGTCCIECEWQCEEHCNKVFNGDCFGCELDK